MAIAEQLRTLEVGTPGHQSAGYSSFTSLPRMKSAARGRVPSCETKRQNVGVTKRGIERELVSCLLREQFPWLADLALRDVELGGWDNTTFRLGEHLVVRLPNEDALVEQIEKEQRWLALIAQQLPFPIPTPVHRGEPGCGFARPWSINRWLDGRPAALSALQDLDHLADDLARFIAELQRVSTIDGPQPGMHNYYRGGPLTVFDDEARRAIHALTGLIEADSALDVWQSALDATWDGPSVWLHGDFTGSNLLIADDRLAGVLDFGCCAVGDPACDLAVAWTIFDGLSRDRFTHSISTDSAAWARARGWTLWKALKGLVAFPEDHPRNNGVRLGWRWTSLEVIDSLISAHHASH